MKALTLHQPYASLIALKVKTIETRTWPAPKSLIGQRIAIHAARGLPWAQVDDEEDGCRVDENNGPAGGVLNWRGPKPAPTEALWMMPGLPGIELPLGAIVASAVLTDCVPMTDLGGSRDCVIEQRSHLWVSHGECKLFVPGRHPLWSNHLDQLPFGNFVPGYWAWLLDDIAPVNERCPWDGCRRGSIEADNPTGMDLHGNLSFEAVCPVCDGAGSCDPIPAKGRQGVWNWVP